VRVHERAWNDAGLTRITLQEARHTAATWLDAAGVSPKVASVLMGHATPVRQPAQPRSPSAGTPTPCPMTLNEHANCSGTTSCQNTRPVREVHAYNAGATPASTSPAQIVATVSRPPSPASPNPSHAHDCLARPYEVNTTARTRPAKCASARRRISPGSIRMPTLAETARLYGLGYAEAFSASSQSGGSSAPRRSPAPSCGRPCPSRPWSRTPHGGGQRTRAVVERVGRTPRAGLTRQPLTERHPPFRHRRPAGASPSPSENLLVDAPRRLTSRAPFATATTSGFRDNPRSATTIREIRSLWAAGRGSLATTTGPRRGWAPSGSLAEEGSFTRAAAYANVAQPALSRQVQKLERELGFPLVDRTTRRVTFTPAATKPSRRPNELSPSLRPSGTPCTKRSRCSAGPSGSG
jgi:hypothetical protein